MLLAFLGASALADQPPPPPSPYQPQPKYPAPEEPAQYRFEWQVKDDYSKNDYGQQEEREGANTQVGGHSTIKTHFYKENYKSRNK